MKNKGFLSDLEAFFDVYLPKSRGVSPNTIKSYKYAFRLLFEYLLSEKGVKASAVTYARLDQEAIKGYLVWLCEKRNCSASTRNLRLAALSSFSAYASNSLKVDSLPFAKAVGGQARKKEAKRQISFFTNEEVKILLSLPDERKGRGYRDKVLLSFMYASGARAQEVCDLRVRDIVGRDDGKSLITIRGKGSKVRRVTIPSNCASMLAKYIKRCKLEGENHVFQSQTHEHMTISCIEEIFKKYVSIAKRDNPGLFAKTYSPHSMRHTTATHMVECGVPLIVIKNFLGHASLDTTQIYAEVTQATMDKYIMEWNETSNIKPTSQPAKSNNIPDFLY